MPIPVQKSLVDEIREHIDSLKTSQCKLSYLETQVLPQLDPAVHAEGDISYALQSEPHPHQVFDLVATYLSDLEKPELAKKVRGYRGIDDSWIHNHTR